VDVAAAGRVGEADNLDRALAVATELQNPGFTAAIEVRPVLEQELEGA
jgi:hypothetical protein